MSNYTIIREENDLDGIECEHPLCDPMHRQWHRRSAHGFVCLKPHKPRIEWLIIDGDTGLRAGWSEIYTTRRDARAALESHTKRTK